MIFRPYAQDATPIQKWLYPILILITALTVDHLTPRVMIIGQLGLVSLALLAFILPPRLQIVWVSVYTVIVYLKFTRNPIINSLDVPHLRVILATINFFIGGILSVVISINRVNSNRSYNDLLGFLLKLPQPVVISDEVGTIVFVNDTMLKLTNCSQETLLGSSYFAYFVNPSDKGRTIEKYMNMLSSSQSHAVTTQLQLKFEVLETITATLSAIGPSNKRFIATVIGNKI